MTKIPNSKQHPFDLEERTFIFAERTRKFVKQLPNTTGNLQDTKQLVRSSGSVGANYIEANEALSKKDFFHRIKICRKEAKESKMWLRLIDVGSRADLREEQAALIQEATELTKISNAIIERQHNSNLS